MPRGGISNSFCNGNNGGSGCCDRMLSDNENTHWRLKLQMESGSFQRGDAMTDPVLPVEVSPFTSISLVASWHRSMGLLPEKPVQLELEFESIQPPREDHNGAGGDRFRGAEHCQNPAVVDELGKPNESGHRNNRRQYSPHEQAETSRVCKILLYGDGPMAKLAVE